MRLVGTENERVSRPDFSRTILVTNASLSRNHQVKLPLCRMCVVRKICFPGWYSIPFQIKWMTLRQIERVRYASERFRNSFERHCVSSARRLPRFFLDFV